MLAPAPETTVLAPARAQPAVPGRPHLFHACLVTANLWTALIAALMWCYATVAYRLTTGQPTSVLLWLTVATAAMAVRVARREGLLATRRRLVVAA